MENTARQGIEQAAATLASPPHDKPYRQHGEREHISMATLIKICETLNCDITDIIELVPDNERQQNEA
ncbi:helix-turn-helix domain-containing protein [Bacilliculturomica massiliensis]